MIVRYTDLDGIDERHPDELVRLGQPEVRFAEYKSALPSGSDAEGKELLADVCSFTNASGGDLVYGIEEAGGTPTALTGVSKLARDAEVLSLENIILSSVDPRPPSSDSPGPSSPRAAPPTAGASPALEFH